MSYTSDIEFITNNINFDFDFDFTDTIKTKENFNFLIDSLQKDNLISEKTRQNIYLVMNKKTKNAFICCGSYKIKVN